MFEVGAIVSRMKLDKSGWDTSTKAVEKDTQKMGGFFSRNSENIKKMGMGMTIAGGIIVAGFGRMIKEASAAEEITSKFYAVFKDEAPAAIKWVDSFAEQVGRSRIDLMQWMGILQDTFVPLGFARDKAREFSQTLVGLSVDLASFNDSAEPDVINDLQSAIVGNHETMRKYGVIITQATIDQELLSMGLNKTAVSATESEKAQARLNIIMRGTKDAQGDALRTAEGFANTLRALKAQLRDLAVEIGNAVMPIVRDLVAELKDTVKNVVAWIRENPKLVKDILSLTLKLGGLLLVFGPLLLVINKVSAGISLMKGNIGKIIPSLGKFGTKINAIKSPLGKVGAVGVAAFVGWKVGRLIGELTGLDKVLQGVFTSVFKLDEKYGGLNAEFQKGHTAAEAKKQDMLAQASEKAGKKVTYIGDAIRILSGEQKTNIEKTGEATEKQEGLTKSFKKYLDSMDIKLLSDKNAKMDELKGHLDTLDQLYQDNELSLEDYKEAVKKTKDEIDELNGVVVTAKDTWKDYLDSLGLKTLKEKGDRVKELEGYLSDLTDAYDRGELSLEDYIKATRTAKDEIKNLSTEITTTAIPAARDMAGVVDRATTEIEDRAFDGAEAIKRNYESVSPVIQTIVSAVQGAWDGLFNHLKEGTLTFKTAWETVWGGVKNTFFGILQDMVTKWTTDFVMGIVSGSSKAGKAAETLSGGASTLGTTITGLAKGIASILPAIAEGIAKAAKAIFSALPEIIAIGAAALALYAGFMAVNKLLGSSGGKNDAGNRLLELIQANTKELRDIMFIDYRQILLRDMQDRITAILQKIDVLNESGYIIRGLLVSIKDNTKIMADKMSNMVKAASGAVLDRGPEMIVAGEVPEVVAPVDRILSMAGGKGKKEVHIYLNNQFAIKTYDSNDMRRNVRNEILPLMIEGLRSGVKKVDLKEALGV